MLVLSPDPPGLVALVGERAVGWCAVGPRQTYPQYEAEPLDDAWAIPCISLEDDARDTNVARMLVEAGVAYAAARGATVIEGPPSYWLAGSRDIVETAKRAFLSCEFVETGRGARMPLLQRRIGRGGA